MKTVGIIGGLGTETTADFYVQVASACAQRSEVHRPPMLIWNVPSPFALEQDVVKSSDRVEDYKPLLLEAAQILEKGGADFVVLPCNTLHLFIDAIAASINIPVLSMVDAVVEFVKAKEIDSLGLIGTGVTRSAGFYERAFAAQAIQVISPNDIEQEKLGDVIVDLLNMRHGPHKETLEEVIDHLANQGLEHTMLACTDLQVLKPKHASMHIYDTMNILADATVQHILS